MKCLGQDTSLFVTSGLMVYKYDRAKISKNYKSLKERLKNKPNSHFNLADDTRETNDNFFLNGINHFQKAHAGFNINNNDSPFILHSSDFFLFVYVLEKKLNIKFPFVSERPCVPVPYISIRGIRDNVYRGFKADCTFIQVNLFVDDQEFCKKLNGTIENFSFRVGEDYKIFILAEVNKVSSYLENIRYDKDIKVLKIPYL